MFCFILEFAVVWSESEVVLRWENYVQVDALTVVDFTMLYVVMCRLLLLSCVSLLVINLLTIRERVRKKRQGMKLIWGPIYFQAVLKYYTHFFHKIHSNNSLRDKMYDGPLFSI